MRCKILHESRGRIRVHVLQNKMTPDQADMIEFYMREIAGITDVKVYDRTADVVICYITDRQSVIRALAGFSYEKCHELVPEEHTGRRLNREFEDKLVFSVLRRLGSKLFLPMPVRAAIAAAKSFGYIKKGISSLIKGKIEVAVLDATAITVSMLRADYDTASSIMFLLHIGEILEEWTHKKSVDDLARTMSLNVDKAWVRTADGQEVLVSVNGIRIGNEIVVRTGNMIPMDGRVVAGEATVNQASITGESLPVRKDAGCYAYAGTVVEEGECVICVDKNSGSGRYDRIVRMIEESEKLKSVTEDKASHLADRLVPYSLGGTILTYALTRNVTKALSILMVDFSCALKLSMPIAVLSAMRESSYYNISVKGGRFLEAVAQADTIVFDKTGTLTHASPKVARIITFGKNEEKEMLRLAACLEEHYPHSMANAVVAEAKVQQLCHEERHSKVEYVVAHGISSIVDEKKVVIGSYHFVFQDEGCCVPEAEQEKFDNLPDEYSHLFMAVSGELAAIICIEDPLREEASAVINSLHKLGISKIVMMTGDNERTAKKVAENVGVDEYHAEVLPEDKANFIKAEHEAGRKVIMIGDGINDSPALSEADAGIAISDGAAIAREIADITISADDLFALVTLESISTGLMKRIHKNYRFIISFNLMLIILGVAGILTPSASALLHNMSTLGISLRSMTNLLD
ncbi:MAG: heavy metal translocating P-type ATPase [Clostridia bacterium]|nr:heavy metal translocating P-type ATPase [Clostridia bacterium]NCC42940.1 heavy metal translocating P-type ATPase [Clostridia bacterium]